jgi:hypothetical protein
MPYAIGKGHGCPKSKPFAVYKKTDGKKLERRRCINHPVYQLSVPLQP